MATAQDPAGNKQGSREEPPKGFFRRLRDDIRGSVEKEREEAEKKQKDRAREKAAENNPAGRVPTPAIPPRQSLNSSEGRFSGIQSPYPGTLPGPDPRQLQVPSGFRLSDSFAAPQGPAGTPGPGRSDGPPKTGFGLTLVEEGEKLFIKAVIPDGNASTAGLRPGDLIVSIGGVPVASIAEFDGITGVMGAGDQIEIGFARRGKEDRVLLQFGSPAENAAAESSDRENTSAGQALPAPPEALEGPSLMPPDATDFVPPPDAAPPRTGQIPGSSRNGNQAVNRTPVPFGSSILQNGQHSPETAALSEPRAIDPRMLLELQSTVLRQQQTIEQLQEQLRTLQTQNSGRRRN